MGDLAHLREVQEQDDRSVFNEDGEKTKEEYGRWLRCFAFLVWRALLGALLRRYKGMERLIGSNQVQVAFYSFKFICKNCINLNAQSGSGVFYHYLLQHNILY